VTPGSGIGIGIDLGGTVIKAAAFDMGDGSVVARKTTPTRDGEFARASVPAFADGVAVLVAELRAAFSRPVAAIGISAPGIAGRDHQTIEFLPTKMAGIEGFDWAGHLGLPPDLPFAVLNDAHAALIGEMWTGCARGRRDVIMLTLGTGVGGAVVSDGKLITGTAGRAGHFGHLSLDPDGPPDICGTPGSLEDAIGNHSVTRRSGGRFRSTHELVLALRHGDPEAAGVWGRSVRALGAAIVGLINAFDPEAVVLGGGIATAKSELLTVLAPYLDRHEWRPGGRQATLLFATLSEFAGAAGAVRFAASRLAGLELGQFFTRSI
jgi:glucokinase